MVGIFVVLLSKNSNNNQPRSYSPRYHRACRASRTSVEGFRQKLLGDVTFHRAPRKAGDEAE